MGVRSTMAIQWWMRCSVNAYTITLINAPHNMQVFNCDVETLFQLLFTDHEFFKGFLKSRRTISECFVMFTVYMHLSVCLFIHQAVKSWCISMYIYGCLSVCVFICFYKQALPFICVWYDCIHDWPCHNHPYGHKNRGLRKRWNNEI